MDCTVVRERETRIYDSERPGRMLSQDQPSTSSSSNVVLDFDDLPDDVLDVLDIPMPSVPTFQHNENVLVYMAGYIGKKVVGKFGSCTDCALFTTADYTSTDSRYTFLRGKQYSDLSLGEDGLKVPSTEFVEFIIALETNFRHKISSVIHAVGLGEKLLNSGMEVYTSKCRDVVCKTEKCKNTLVYIIKLFNRVRIHHILRTQNRLLSQPKQKRNRNFLKQTHL